MFRILWLSALLTPVYLLLANPSLKPSLKDSFPHVIFHFDINQTLILGDTAKSEVHQIQIDKILEQNLAIAFAEQVKFRWNGGHHQTFGDYVRNDLVPGDKLDEHTRNARRNIMINFIKHIEDYVPSSRDRKKILREYQLFYQKAVNNEGKLREGVFPSFFKMLDKLNSSNIHYTLILRTFGQDLHLVKKSIEDFLNVRCVFLEGVFDTDHFRLENHTFSNPNEFYNYMRRLKFVAIKDDYKVWKYQQYKGCAGKRFVYQQNEHLDQEPSLSIFIDDNYSSEPDKWCIVCPCECSDIDFKPEAGLVYERSQTLKNRKIFRASTYHALTDENYFIKLLNMALKAHNFPEIPLDSFPSIDACDLNMVPQVEAAF